MTLREKEKGKKIITNEKIIVVRKRLIIQKC
jgi:hypothetical protein